MIKVRFYLPDDSDFVKKVLIGKKVVDVFEELEIKSVCCEVPVVPRQGEFVHISNVPFIVERVDHEYDAPNENEDEIVFVEYTVTLRTPKSEKPLRLSLLKTK